MPEKYLHIAMTSPVPGREDEFNEWYENVHVPEVLTIPGFLSGQRFRLVDPDRGEGPRYLAVYQIESDDVAATIDVIAGTAPGRTKSPAIDVSASVIRTYEAIGERHQPTPPTE